MKITSPNPQQQLMVLSNLDLIKNIAKTIFKKGLSVCLTERELMGAGYEALVSAAMHYDCNRNASFKTYAARCMYNAILAEIKLFSKFNYVDLENIGEYYIDLWGEKESDRLRCSRLEALDNAIEQLDPNDRALIRGHFGLNCKKLTLKELGHLNGVSHQAIDKKIKKMCCGLQQTILRQCA